MPDPIMYSGDTFVVLQADQPEQFLTQDELRSLLKTVLAARQDPLPRELERFSSLDEQVQYLIDTSCELDVGKDQFLQWYLVRLEK